MTGGLAGALAAVVLACLGVTAWAEPSNLRLCGGDDLKGTFLMVDFKEKPEAGETAWHRQFPYQYLSFTPPDGYASLALRNKVTTPAQLDPLMRTGTYDRDAKIRKYQLGTDGRLDLYIGEKISRSYRCMASSAKSGIYQKGDLLLTAYSEKRRTEIRELYRLWY